MDGSSFRSTVLQRPRSQHEGDDELRDRERDRERDRQSQHHQHRHDTLNPGSANQAPQHPPPPPGSTSSASASASAHRHSESSFRVRSPSGGASDYQHHSSHYASPTSSHHRHSLHLQSPPRPALHSPVSHYMAPAKPQGSPPSGGPVAPTLPPPAGLAPPQTSGPNMSSSHHHHPPLGPSPLHPPPAYFSPSEHHARDSHSSAGTKRRFYDPTTDISSGSSSERRVSDSWQDTTPKHHQPRDSLFHPPTADRTTSYFEAPSQRPPPYGSSRPRSPPAHSYTPSSGGPISPSHRPAHMTSPNVRQATTPSSATSNGASGLAPLPRGNLASPSKASSTPSRAADPMSFSNILSSSEPAPKPRDREPSPTPVMRAPDIDIQPKRERTPEPVAEPKSQPRLEKKESEPEPEPEPEAEPEEEPVKEAEPTPIRKKETKRKPAARRSAIHAIEDLKESGSKSRRNSSKKDSPAPRATKRQVNGQEKEKEKEKEKKTWAPEMERVIQSRERSIDKNIPDLEANEADEEEYKMRAAKRLKLMARSELARTDVRRDDYARSASQRLRAHAELGKRRYDEMFYEEALLEVREQELFAEKERKKDMQRKRRREKSMAVTMEQKEAALARADAAEDENERQKHLRDAERANKKAQQTKLILAKGIKGPARTAELNLNLEGGTMSSFQASDVESGSKPKKSRSGNRPKKSKEQKQAEKDSAEAAQAALDAGEELPTLAPREESTKAVRIKIKKSKEPKEEKKSKDKDKDKDKSKEDKTKADADADKENKDVPSEVDEAAEKEKRFQTKGYNQIYDQIWRDMARKDVSKTFKLASDSYTTKSSNLKKTGILASKEAKRWQLRTNKGTKDLQARAKRVMRDMMSFWKRNEREERDLRKAAEKQELENARKEEADREAARQKRKLNFLISQTELYSHFIGKKIKTDEVERSTDHPDVAKDVKEPSEPKLNIAEPTSGVGSKVTNFENLDFDDEDESNLQAAAMANAQNAIAEAQKKAREFNNESLDMDEEGEMNFQNPAGMGDVEIEQPGLLNAQLKEYQLKGLNWLVNLYEQGINGILADEMGLGKTVQSISVMAYLAEKHDIWGPFLVVAPASTLHNWQQEIAKFVPEFKILPYWGNAADRKILRKFWDRKHSTYRKDAAFHVCVTSYQLVVSDVAYFQKMRWQYMILDEAQAIKSSQSSRWKSLLGFHCRNRLLLTGTPIQNNMQELWALLHFIMPSLFDSHDEFSEWFSKDIESHAQSNTKLNEDQLKRLHMILKPFMLRRVKKHVQKELGDKIEEDVFCDLTYRQRAYYSNLRNQINIMDLVEKATVGDDQDSSTLMNLVMQFRKVCNHPDLFERAEVTSPFSFGYFAETASFVREGNNVPVPYSVRSLIDLDLPSLVWTEDGRLDKASRSNQKAGWRNQALGHMMNIYTPDYIRQNTKEAEGYSWLRFADVSPGEVYKATHQSLFNRAADELQKRNRLGYMGVAYDDPEDKSFTPAHALFKIRDRQVRQPLADITGEGVMRNLMNVARQDYNNSGLGRLEQAGKPRASAPPVQVSCNSRSAIVERENIMFNVAIRKNLYGPSIWEEEALVEKRVPLHLYPTVATMPKPDNEKRGFTNIAVPSMQRFVTDSGKLAKLDELLFRLKAENHRVLLYFQMTRMIDMMEEYLTYRNYKYCRLDGSTKLEDRRDTVHDFQTRPEIFIFLLSTRAGGLGINLTSADTVIFYDSDWNPTIDSQAMDRAHRLGQTRQVTVYRLITKGTIEERIRKRALQKEEVQRVVIQGGGASVDFSGRRAPENRNRDIAMWLADDEQAELIEKREKEMLESGEFDKQKKKGGKRAKKAEQPSLDEMYHEGEGHFDDGSKPGMSGTATPAESDTKTKKGRTKGSNKKAKTTKQRLAMADGMVDM